MPSLARTLSLAFSAGVVGALANSLAAWASGAYGVSQALGVSAAPAFTLAWLYPRLVWGGLWGLLFAVPLARPRGLALGLLIGLAPAAYQLLVVLPQRGAGLLGLERGALTPLLVLILTAIWGLTAAIWLRLVCGAA
jgi:hypothetical protein